MFYFKLEFKLTKHKVNNSFNVVMNIISISNKSYINFHDYVANQFMFVLSYNILVHLRIEEIM